MSDLFGNHIFGFPTRRLKCHLALGATKSRAANAIISITFDLTFCFYYCMVDTQLFSSAENGKTYRENRQYCIS